MNKILAILLTVVLIFGNIANVAAYSYSEEEYYNKTIMEYYTTSPTSLIVAASSTPVTTVAELRNAVDAAPTDGTPTIIALGANITMPAGAAGNAIIVGNGRHIILTGGTGGYALIRDTTGQRHFIVNADSTLQLQNITFSGNYPTLTSNHGGVQVNAGGHLIMEDGSAITNNRHGGASQGGGVFVTGADAQFTMNSGIISGNSTVANTSAGGVFVQNGAVFTMSGGEISDNSTTGNTTGGVFVQGAASQFFMGGGVIRDNIGRFGGGVRIGAGALIPSALPTITSAPSMYMDGGKIHGNTALFGGGVNLEWGLFTMAGGIIWDNTATSLDNAGSSLQHNRGGGGVFVQNSGIFAMEDGKIYDNHSHFHGGGVMLIPNTTFNMTGGTISDNTAVNNGGGIAAAQINASGNPAAGSITVSMTSGTITGNTAVNGGGIWLTQGTGAGSHLAMSAGTIANNTATNDGGGIWLGAGNVSTNIGARLNMTGGTISNNRAEGNGGGIFTSSYNYVDPLPTINAYPNISPRDASLPFPGTIFGNTAGNGQFRHPVNYYVLPFGHLLNNYQINYIGSTLLWTVTFEVENITHGNIAGKNISTDVFETNEYPTVPSVNEETGWQFIGWVRYGGDPNEILTYQDIETTPVVENARFIALFVPMHNVTFNLHGGEDPADFPLQQVLNGDYAIRPTGEPTREGFEFIGWSNVNNSTVLFDFENTPITANTVIHALWVQSTTPPPPPDPGGSLGGGSTPHVRPPVFIPSEPTPNQIFTHRPYIFGFPDGTMQPNGFLTRAQVAQIYFNLSDTPNKHAILDASHSVFHDVNHGDWYFDAIFYAKQSGVITGFPDGSFRPNDYITNAELSAFIAHAFTSNAEERFTHESILNHWARHYVAITFHPFWISYFGADYIFAPDDAITRGQAASLFNNFLGRVPSKSCIDAYLGGRQLFPDLHHSHNLFYELMEANILHQFIWSENNEQEIWQVSQ